MVSPTDLSTMTNQLLNNDRARENLLREYKQKFENIPDDLRIMKVNAHYLEMTTYPKQQDGSVETRRSVQYWR